MSETELSVPSGVIPCPNDQTGSLTAGAESLAASRPASMMTRLSPKIKYRS